MATTDNPTSDQPIESVTVPVEILDALLVAWTQITKGERVDPELEIARTLESGDEAWDVLNDYLADVLS